MAIATTNPATGQVEQTFAEHTDAEIEAALVRAVEAFADYRNRSVENRAALVQAAAQIMDDDNERLARLAVVEMGKPLAQARAEVSKCATALRYYAEHAPAMLRDEPVATEAESFKRYLPVGPVLAVMPWNFPFWQVVRFLAPAFMAGNVALLKHASNVPQCALALEQVFAQAGFPSGVMQTLLIGSAKVEKLLADPRVAAATLTGSEGAGAAVGASAGGQIKKTVLELGGSDPFLVMASADLSKAVATAVKAR
ncbi:MAG: aldehyde dehydrogenase family protein, partial [Pseudomonadales bacterium]